MKFIFFLAAMVACQGRGGRGERPDPGSRPPPPPGSRPGERPPPPPGRADGQLINQNSLLTGGAQLSPTTVSPQTQPAAAAAPAVVPAAETRVSAAPLAVKAAPILQQPSISNLSPKAKVTDNASPPKSASPITESSSASSTPASELQPSEAESPTSDLGQSSTPSSPTLDPNQNAAVPFSITSSSNSSSSNQSSSAIIASIVTLSLVFLCGLGYWGYNRHQSSVREKLASKEKYEKLMKLQIQDEKLLKEIYDTPRPSSLCSIINSSVAPVVDSASSETSITILETDV